MRTSTGKGQGEGVGEQHRKLHPPFAQPDPGRRATPHMAAETATAVDASETLPFIERFVDDLPLIDEFLLEPSDGAPTNPDPASGATGAVTSVAAAETDTEGWAPADWQSYDWSGLASLAAPEPEAAEAHAAWSSTNWDAGGPGSLERSHRLHNLREDEVAAALDEIARRIRSGELSLYQFRESPPAAAIAAAFASVLRNRG
jgi:hypothetical protein